MKTSGGWSGAADTAVRTKNLFEKNTIQNSSFILFFLNNEIAEFEFKPTASKSQEITGVGTTSDHWGRRWKPTGDERHVFFLDTSPLSVDECRGTLCDFLFFCVL
jgi:hypothetical protein